MTKTATFKGLGSNSAEYGAKGDLYHYQLEPAYSGMTDVVISVIESSLTTGQPDMAMFPADADGMLDDRAINVRMLGGFLGVMTNEEALPSLTGSDPERLLASLGYVAMADLGAGGE
jgi:hypothetical protein